VLIETAPGMVVVGEAGTGAEAVEVARAERPDVVLMDIRMPGMNGLEATRRICEGADTRACRVIVLTTFDIDEYVYGALRAGASGFLLKDSPPAELLGAVRIVAAGDALLAPGITRRLIGQFARMPVAAAPRAAALAHLTEREAEVLGLVARGLSNSEIADRLVISPATVKSHIGHLLGKLDARDRAQLVIAAYEGGLVSPA
jgi:DNA-binding NarL/FixJ family response regulator